MSASMDSRASLPPGAVVALDLDGVVWRGRATIAGAPDAIVRLRAAGHRVVFVTNNSARTVGEVVDQLRAAGIDAEPDDVVGSAAAAARLLLGIIPAGSDVLVAGGPGVIEALQATGFVCVRNGDARAVVVGWHADFDFERLTVAMRAIRNGACFVATNTDATYPTEAGLLPGGGSIVAAVATASGVVPIVAGKPHAPIADLVRERFGSSGVVVGDRIDTDGALAANLGWPFALVLSGVTDSVPERDQPTYLAPTLADLTTQWLAADC